METSIVIARLIGPVLFILGLYVLLCPVRLRAVAEEFLINDGLMFIGGLMAIVTGVAIVGAHNIWVLDWPVIITLFGWIALSAGIMRLLVGDGMRSMGRLILDNRAFMVVDGLIMTALGAYLSTKGFGWV